MKTFSNTFFKGTFLRAVLIIGFFILFGRLSELQIIKGAYFRSLSDDNRIRTYTIAAPRGKILARGGEILADTKIVKKHIDNLVDALDVPERIYPLASGSAQITGYLSQITGSDVGKIDPHCPQKGTHVISQLYGQSGIEQSYDCNLRGIDGSEMVEVDIYGNKLRTIGRRPATLGENEQTTIDFGLQKSVVTALNGKIGAVVATDTEGQVLALFSSPSFDPNAFINPDQNKDIVSKYLTDPTLPLFNRAITGTYHPGSIFKLIVGAAALRDQAINSQSKFTDTGVLSVNGFDYSSWYFTQYGRVEGEQTLSQALARSTDTFFYRVGEMEGIDRLVYWADKFGVGRKSGIDIPGESSGILPSPVWKQANLGEKWYLGNTFHFSIGQGDLLVSPLQANLWTAVFANGGYYCNPYISLTHGKKKCERLDIPTEVLSEVKKGMKMACSTGGTAYPFFEFSPEVICKTGTAETGNKDKTHAWFTVIAPAEKPEIVVTVLVEKGGEGSSVAAPIAKEILDYWFHHKELEK